MKHISDVTKQRPALAAPFQDIICDVNEALASILEAKGSSLVLVDLVADKCEIPPQDQA